MNVVSFGFVNILILGDFLEILGVCVEEDVCVMDCFGEVIDIVFVIVFLFSDLL